MMKRRTHLRRRRELKLSPLCLIAAAGAAGYFVVFTIISVFSFVTSKVTPDNSVLSAFTALALAAGAYFGGYISAKNRHKNGLLMGICCGLFMFLVIILVGVFISGSSDGFGAPVKFLITVVFGGVGGIIGVNSTTFR